LVAQLGDEKTEKRADKRAAMADVAAGLLGVFLLRQQRPDREGDKRQGQRPAQNVRRQVFADPMAEQAGDDVACQRRDENAPQHRNRIAIGCGEIERQELRLVAEFRQENDAEAGKESFHHNERGPTAELLSLPPPGLIRGAIRWIAGSSPAMTE